MRQRALRLWYAEPTIKLALIGILGITLVIWHSRGKESADTFSAFDSDSSNKYSEDSHGEVKVEVLAEVSALWRTRRPEVELKCDPSNDYFSELQGRNWNAWMQAGHSIENTYEKDELTPRVPCNPYWRTGPHACAATFGSPAYSNASLKKQCDAVLDNGYERGRALPAALSRQEGWPHLGPSAAANVGRALPTLQQSDVASSLRASQASSKASPWALGYPLRVDQGNARANEADTLELLSAVAFGQPAASMDQFAVNFGANDGATSDPVAVLFHDGWRGVAVEMESNFCNMLAHNLQHTNATVHCPLAVTPHNAAGLLSAAGAPRRFDYLKIDIDSYDCDVLAAILAAGYRPKVIQMETGTIPPPVRFASHFTNIYSRPHAQIYQAFGCSLSYADDLLNSAGLQYTLVEASLDSVWIETTVLQQTIAAHAQVNSASATLMGRFAAEAAADVAHSRDRDARALTRYINGFWRWPWRRELHIWEIGTEHWFLLQSDVLRLAAMHDHMSCVDACFHSQGRTPLDDVANGWSVADAPREARPFEYTLQTNPIVPPFRGDVRHPSTPILRGIH